MNCALDAAACALSLSNLHAAAGAGDDFGTVARMHGRVAVAMEDDGRHVMLGAWHCAC